MCSDSSRLSPIQFTPTDATQLSRRIGRCELADMVHRHTLVTEAGMGLDGMYCAGNAVYFDGVVHTPSYQCSPSHPSFYHWQQLFLADPSPPHPIPSQRVCVNASVSVAQRRRSCAVRRRRRGSCDDPATRSTSRASRSPARPRPSSRGRYLAR